MSKPSAKSFLMREEKVFERSAKLREKWVKDYKDGIYNIENPKIAAQWREKWLSGIKLGKSYDLVARYNAAKWAVKWTMESFMYTLGENNVAPLCTELVLEALNLHGGRPILPIKVDRLEDITMGLGAGFSSQGEVCGAVTGHIIAIGMDIANRERETAMIRRDVASATRKYCSLFKDKFGSIRCSCLTGLYFVNPDNSENPDAWKEFGAGYPPIGQRCLDFIQFNIYAPLPSEEV
ncbi:MAG: C_GCAxxG_C_C family protein [Dehalococcoidales bacterium]|nr:C_GCAxxG_C_C family protein [Dehalococcoidales bacterium]